MKASLRRRTSKLLTLLAVAGGLPQLWTREAHASIEQDVLRISKQLKPIPDDIWQSIAGARASEKYEVVSGDTLYDISNRLFGDPKYWPKIWSLNNPSITNPHLIHPGTLIAFMPGSGTDLPSISVSPDKATTQKLKTRPEETASHASTAQSPHEPSSARSKEWSRLPRQRWEEATVNLPDEADVIGFGRDMKEKLKMMSSSVTFGLKSMATSKPIPTLGEIVASTKPAPYLTTGDRLFIRAPGQRLQIGQTYTATLATPNALLSRRRKLEGYAYPLMGNILIVGEKDELFIGKVLAAEHLISRGNVLVSPPPRIPILEPILGPDSIEAGIISDPEYSSILVAQNKQIFLDRGSDDGLKPGMVFNVYQYEDPLTQLPFTREHIEKQGEIMVVQVSERFSAAIVIKSEGAIYEGMLAILKSDESLVKKTKPLVNEDDLDKLDQEDGLSRNEKRELRQLEKWKSNPPEESLQTHSMEPAPLPEPAETAPIDTTPVPPAPESTEIPTSEPPPPPPVE